MSLFTKVAVKVPRRNAFKLSHENHLTANFGELVPTLVQECFPGDKFRIQTEASIKLAPLVFPVMGRIDVYFHTFFVPHRLVYDNWEKFITGGETGVFPNGGEQTDANGNPVYVSPYFDFNELFQNGDLSNGSLCDYLGLPSLAFTSGQVVNDVPPISALPFLAYQKIYSDWFRDELLDASEEFVPVTDGKLDPVSTDAWILTKKLRCWHKDYFTSARPDTQLGPEVGVPVSGDIVSDGTLKFKYTQSLGTASSLAMTNVDQEANADGTYQAPIYAGGTTRYVQYSEGLSLDDADILINNLRRALKLQEWQEKNMRGGNRYIENIFHHFGVKSSDARLQRSQYLGGKKIPVVVGEIPQAVDTSGDSDYSAGERYLGERGGIANAAGTSKYITKFCEEHGFIITLMSILPHTSYMQGIPRYLGARWDRFDYLWPEFGNLGEQEVKNWEIFVARGVGQGNEGTFGYQSRMADMKYTPSGIHGGFRDQYGLARWHNGRIFATRPQLNSNFVHFPSGDTAGDQNRIFAVEQNSVSKGHFYCHLFNHVSVLRMLPKYGIPSI